MERECEQYWVIGQPVLESRNRAITAKPRLSFVGSHFSAAVGTGLGFAFADGASPLKEQEQRRYFVLGHLCVHYFRREIVCAHETATIAVV